MRAEQLAQRADLGGDVVLFDYEAGPNKVEQFLFGNETFTALRENQQKVEGTRTEGNGLTVGAQHTLGLADREAAETQRFFDGRRSHGRAFLESR
jgi:hypothetical protein